MFDREKHKNDFFNYVIENKRELQKALKKNITYDPDIFDDVTCNTIVRIAEYIVKNGVKINNFKFFFFIAAKREYIAEQNKKRGLTNNSNRDFFDNIFNGLEKREKQEDLDLYYSICIYMLFEKMDSRHYYQFGVGFTFFKLSKYGYAICFE